jgi:hemoglobin
VHIDFSRIGRRLVVSHGIGLLLVALVAACLAPTGRSLAQTKPQKTLYQRMGGYDVLAGITTDFITQLGKDPAFKRFGGGRSHDSLVRTRQLIVDQLCHLTGGPCAYIGRDMKTAHAGLGITPAEWDSSMKKFKIALDDYKIAAPEQEEFLAIIAKLRPDIVEPPKKQPSKEAKPGSQN